MQKFNKTIEPLWISSATLYPGQEVKPHMHEHYYHMMCVTEGHCEYTSNGNPYILSENMFAIARPNEMHCWKNSAITTSIYEVKFAVFDQKLVDTIENLPPINYGTILTRELFEKILTEMSKEHTDYQEYISMYLNTLLYDIVRDKSEKKKEVCSDSKRLDLPQLVMNYIENHYHEDISLESIAPAINYNKSYISAEFRRVKGCTVGNYIYHVRTHKACELIAYSDLPLADVSAMTGFKSVQHFNRVFKKNIGIPPGEYRGSFPKALTKMDSDELPRFNVIIMPVRAGQIFDVESETGRYRRKNDLETN